MLLLVLYQQHLRQLRYHHLLPVQEETATIIGTTGNDNIVGTQGRDVVVALGGDDRVDARGGDDLSVGVTVTTSY